MNSINIFHESGLITHKFEFYKNIVWVYTHIPWKYFHESTNVHKKNIVHKNKDWFHGIILAQFFESDKNWNTLSFLFRL